MMCHHHRRRRRSVLLCCSSKEHHQLFPLLLICVTSILASFAVVHAFSASSSSSTATTNNTPIHNNNNQASPKVIPITILSGFLGTGKTTLLRNLLQNDKGIKIAVIVNDVADVNIDSKLISQRSGATNNNDNNDNELAGASISNQQPAGMVELQNGCACCSLSSELLPAVSELVTLSDMRQDPNEQFDHIVIEMSGVGNPRSVRSNFQQAMMYGMPLLDRVRLDTMITVVDCGSFLDHIRSGKAATADDAPELFYRDPDAPRPSSNKNEDLLSDLPLMLRAALEEANNGGDRTFQQAEGVGGGVADLLVEQIEIADYILLNKIDESPNSETVDTIEQIVMALNPRAKTFRTTYGKVDMEQILGAALGMGVVECGVVDDHKDAVLAADVQQQQQEQELPIKKEEETGESTDLDHRTDETKSHSHSHEHHHHHHSHADTETTTDSTMHDDHSHSHSHDDEHESHSHSHDDEHKSHSHSSHDGHSHSHSHHHDDDDSAVAACTDPDCTDPTHTHDHNHDHTGIGTYVYRARRPFHPKRLVAFLRHMPVTRGVPPPQEEEMGTTNEEEAEEEESPILISDTVKETLRSLLRSKGFCWIADSNVAASYWSHAGSSFEMQCLGRWWATLPRDQWPEEAKDTILADFDDPSHIDDGDKGSLSQSVGDRRQEIVFIGTGIGNHKEQSNICNSLDTCLLTEDEWKSYLSNAGEEDALRKIFVNPMQSRVVTY